MARQLFKSQPDVSRALAALICIVSAIVCFTYALLRSGLPDWWRENGGGIPYVVFWVAFWFTILPYRRCLLPICVFATTITCLLEFMQLWKPETLTRIRATSFGAGLLGSGFTWSDFPPYFLGGLVGYLILTLVARSRSQRTGEASPR